MTDKVLLIGDGPLAEETCSFLEGKGVSVVFSEDGQSTFDPENVIAVVDVVSGPVSEKRDGLCQGEKRVSEQVPIYTSTLYVSATQAASWLKHPERVIGFSPLLLHEMDVMEVSRPLQGEDVTNWADGLACWEGWGKNMEVVGDEPGLVFPRTLALMVNESAFILTEQGALPEEIDLAMKKGTNHPYGPLEWADRVGVDQIAWILRGLFEELGDDRYRPAPLIRKMVYAKRLGHSTGRGFHRY